jgi:hypothetical protein
LWALDTALKPNAGRAAAHDLGDPQPDAGLVQIHLKQGDIWRWRVKLSVRNHRRRDGVTGTSSLRARGFSSTGFILIFVLIRIAILARC